MKIECNWVQQMEFKATPAEGHLQPGQEIRMDAMPPLGRGSAMTPKQMLLAGLCGCTAMDVVALLKKHKQVASGFRVTVDAAQNTDQHPHVFTECQMEYHLEGTIDAKTVVDCVELSQTKYCGVSAMLAQAMKIRYSVWLNGQQIHSAEKP